MKIDSNTKVEDVKNNTKRIVEYMSGITISSSNDCYKSEENNMSWQQHKDHPKTDTEKVSMMIKVLDRMNRMSK